jgi:hypothetical protein
LSEKIKNTMASIDEISQLTVSINKRTKEVKVFEN